jgi:hypothetical protein
MLTTSLAAAALAVAALGAGGCLQENIDEVDGAFYTGGARSIHCSIDIDSVTDNDLASIDGGLDRARDRGEVIELFAHKPGDTVSWETVEHVFAGARDRNLPFYTYADLATGTVTGPGLAFAFDDDSVDLWTAGRGTFAEYDARLTFFITRYDLLQPDQRDEIRQLAADGHDIEPHTARHLRGPEVVESEGLDAYMDQEVLPSMTRLQNDGYTISAFAYPFGARTDETDRAVLKHVPILRSVATTWGRVAADYCPAD